MHALSSARNFFLSIFYLSGPFSFIFSKSSLYILLALGVDNVRSRVCPRNKVGHTARCKRLMQVPVLGAHQVPKHGWRGGEEGWYLLYLYYCWYISASQRLSRNGAWWIWSLQIVPVVSYRGLPVAWLRPLSDLMWNLPGCISVRLAL